MKRAFIISVNNWRMGFRYCDQDDSGRFSEFKFYCKISIIVSIDG